MNIFVYGNIKEIATDRNISTAVQKYACTKNIYESERLPSFSSKDINN